MRWRRLSHRPWRETATACKPTASRVTPRAGARLDATNPVRAARARSTSTATADLAEAAQARRRWISISELVKSQLFSESAIPLEVPFATHRVALARAAFRIKQHPCAAARRAGAFAGIMRRQSTGHVVGPADIGQVAGAREGTDNIDVAVHVSSALVPLKSTTGNC